CERDASLNFRPIAAQPFGISAQLPIQIRFDNLTHLAVGRGISEAVDSIGQHLTKSHAALIVLRKPERGFTQRARERGKQKLRRRFIVPDMRAVSEAAAALIVASFKPVKLAILGAKRSLRDERG